MADEEAKGKAKTLIEIGQRMDNQKDSSQMVIGVILLKMTEKSRDISDVAKRIILKEIA